MVIYINYSEEEITYDNCKIKAQDYLILDSKGEY
jgi:hypothetical protein